MSQPPYYNFQQPSPLDAYVAAGIPLPPNAFVLHAHMHHHHHHQLLHQPIQPSAHPAQPLQPVAQSYHIAHHHHHMFVPSPAAAAAMSAQLAAVQAQQGGQPMPPMFGMVPLAAFAATPAQQPAASQPASAVPAASKTGVATSATTPAVRAAPPPPYSQYVESAASDSNVGGVSVGGEQLPQVQSPPLTAATTHATVAPAPPPPPFGLAPAVTVSAQSQRSAAAVAAPVQQQQRPLATFTSFPSNRASNSAQTVVATYASATASPPQSAVSWPDVVGALRSLGGAIVNVIAAAPKDAHRALLGTPGMHEVDTRVELTFAEMARCGNTIALGSMLMRDVVTQACFPTPPEGRARLPNSGIVGPFWTHYNLPFVRAVPTLIAEIGRPAQRAAALAAAAESPPETPFLSPQTHVIIDSIISSQMYAASPANTSATSSSAGNNNGGALGVPCPLPLDRESFIKKCKAIAQRITPSVLDRTVALAQKFAAAAMPSSAPAASDSKASTPSPNAVNPKNPFEITPTDWNDAVQFAAELFFASCYSLLIHPTCSAARHVLVAASKHGSGGNESESGAAAALPAKPAAGLLPCKSEEHAEFLDRQLTLRESVLQSTCAPGFLKCGMAIAVATQLHNEHLERMCAVVAQEQQARQLPDAVKDPAADARIAARLEFLQAKREFNSVLCEMTIVYFNALGTAGRQGVRGTAADPLLCRLGRMAYDRSPALVCRALHEVLVEAQRTVTRPLAQAGGAKPHPFPSPSALTVLLTGGLFRSRGPFADSWQRSHILGLNNNTSDGGAAPLLVLPVLPPAPPNLARGGSPSSSSSIAGGDASNDSIGSNASVMAIAAAAAASAAAAQHQQQQLLQTTVQPAPAPQEPFSPVGKVVTLPNGSTIRLWPSGDNAQEYADASAAAAAQQQQQQQQQQQRRSGAADGADAAAAAGRFVPLNADMWADIEAGLKAGYFTAEQALSFLLPTIAEFRRAPPQTCFKALSVLDGRADRNPVAIAASPTKNRGEQPARPDHHAPTRLNFTAPELVEIAQRLMGITATASNEGQSEEDEIAAARKQEALRDAIEVARNRERLSSKGDLTDRRPQMSDGTTGALQQHRGGGGSDGIELIRGAHGVGAPIFDLGDTYVGSQRRHSDASPAGNSPTFVGLGAEAADPHGALIVDHNNPASNSAAGDALLPSYLAPDLLAALTAALAAQSSDGGAALSAGAEYSDPMQYGLMPHSGGAFSYAAAAPAASSSGSPSKTVSPPVGLRSDGGGAAPSYWQQEGDDEAQYRRFEHMTDDD